MEKQYEDMTEEEKQQEREKREEEAQKKASGEEEEKDSEDDSEKDSEKGSEDDSEKESEKDPEEESDKDDPKAEIDKIVEDKLKPFKEQEEERRKQEEKKVRDAFFDNNPQYLTDAKKWQALLDEMDNLNPNLSYAESLEKAHRILDGTSRTQEEIDEFKTNQAFASSGAGESKQTAGEEKAELTAADRRLMKNAGVDEEAIKLLKKKQKDGSMQVFYPTI
jgi:hypothetical protein